MAGLKNPYEIIYISPVFLDSKISKNYRTGYANFFMYFALFIRTYVFRS